MDLFQRVRSNINHHRMAKQGDTVVVAVSGGPDSVALLHILYTLKDDLGLSLHVAHLNHMFRGKESLAEARFVADLAGRYDLPATVESFDVPAYRNEKRLSVQSAAREVRYRFLMDTAARERASRVALAHQADDQAETILNNFLRGTGVSGLKGILPVRDGLYIRPLLNVRRYEIESFCSELGLSCCCDPSNLKPVYTRNKIRLELLPLLEREYNPALVPALLRLGEICREEDACLDEISEETYKKALVTSGSGFLSLRRDVVDSAPLAVRRRVLRKAWGVVSGGLKEISFEHTGDLVNLLEAGATGGRAVLPGDITALLSYHHIDFAAKMEDTELPVFVHPLQIPGTTPVPELDLDIYAALFERKPGLDPGTLPPDEVFLDFDKLQPCLFVRRRREGDLFQPFGRKSEVKLKDFLIKQKVPRKERDRIPLVCTPEEIVWAGGIRAGEKWKIDDQTLRVLHLKILPYC